jgi:putative endopeptidase
MKKLILAAALTTGAVPALMLTADSSHAAQQPARKAAFGDWGIDLTARNPATAPGDSFFGHVNGGWFAGATIPPDQPLAGVSMDLYSRTQAQLRAIIEESARNPRTENERKIGPLYNSFLDEERIESLDAQPLQAELAEIRAARTHADITRMMARNLRGYGASLFGIAVIPDVQGERLYTPALDAAGIGLPDRDYYLAEQFRPHREAYSQYLARTLGMIGWGDAEAVAGRVLAFETRIAEAHWSRTEQRDPNRLYNPMSPAELGAYAPGFDWNAFLTEARLGGTERIIVGQKSAVQKLARLFAGTDPETLRAWLAFRLTNEVSPFLSRRFVENQFAFQQVLSGQPQMWPRWQRAVSVVEGTLGEALGQEYVRRHFPASSRRAVQDMVGNLQQAMRRRIEGAGWMSPQTRAEALRKLDRQRVKVGYPDRWRDYSGVRIDAGDLYGNVERAAAFAVDYQFNRIGQPLDRDEWLMTPQTLNAYYHPVQNEIVFPAAMLQAPMFDPNADPAVNYGAIGAVIGHEITHGFDDQGRQFDADGQLRDWWTPEDAARFSAAAGQLAAQYDGYEGVPGANVNGRLTLGENIGDQGGLRLALDAYHASLGGRPAPVIGGYTGDQRLFMAWAQGWRNKMREEQMRMLLVTDVHSPHRWRVDGAVRNFDEWHRAFDVRPGQALYLAPDQRVRVW